MGRFDLNLSDVSTTRPTCASGTYIGRLAKAEIRSGDDKNGDPWAGLNVSVAILDPEVSKVLGMDEPKMFFSGMFAFDAEGKFNKSNCAEIGQFLEVTGFGSDMAAFEDETTELAETERDYVLALFKNMCASAAGVEVIAKVVRKKHYKEDYMVNEVSQLAKPADE